MHRHDDFVDEGIGAVADDDLQIGEVGGHTVNMTGMGVVHHGVAHQRCGAGGDDNRNIQLTALGIDGIVPGMIGGDARQIGIDGSAAHAVIIDHALEFVDGGHALVRVETGEADELVGVLLHQGHNAGVGGAKAVGGFSVAAGHHALDHALLFHVGDDLFNGLGLGPVGVLEKLEHAAEDLVVQHALNGVRGAGPETKVNDFHTFIPHCPGCLPGDVFFHNLKSKERATRGQFALQAGKRAGQASRHSNITS